MKRLFHLFLFNLITASLLLTACTGLRGVATTETTIIIETTQGAVPSLPPTDIPAPTATPAPTSTPLPTETSAPTQPPIASETPTLVPTLANTATVVPSSPTALVKENTNCRTGPSSDYPVVVVFMSGESATIVSKTTLPDYVLVQDPNNTTQSCWLWAQYVTINGDLSGLPVATPPPPLVSFTVAYTRKESCPGYSLEFKIQNTGPKTLQAYTVVAKDLTSHTQQTSTSTVFDYRYMCAVQTAIGYIDTGKVGYVYADNFSYDPTGHSFEATITICSHNDQTGVCATQTVVFVP